MPVVSFSDRDLMRGKVITPAWYRVVINSVGEAPAKASEKGPSTNYPVEATIQFNGDDGSTEFAGVPLDWNFNSKAISFAAGFLAALGVDVRSGARFELANAIGKQIEIFVENDTWQGRMLNRVNHKYRPLRG